MNWKIFAIIIMGILLISNVHGVTYTNESNVKAQNSTTYIDSLPFSNSKQLYVFENGYAACNGSLGIISLDKNDLIFAAKKFLYIPKYRRILFINNSGLYSFSLDSKQIVRLLSNSLDNFWVSAGQEIIYAWKQNTLWVIDHNGLLRTYHIYDLNISYVVPYAYNYWLAVVVKNSTYSKVYIYSDGTKLTLSYVRERNITSDFMFIDWGGDRTIIYANTTHMFYWRTYYNSQTVISLPEALKTVREFFAIPYWSYSIVISDGERVFIRSSNTWYSYTFSGGVIYAKLYIGMRTWSSDYPWIIIASNDGLRIIYKDPDDGQWTSQVLYSQKVDSDIFIDDIDEDGIEEFYFVANGQLIKIEIEKIIYSYSYRAVIPLLYFWSGKFIMYDRSASDWDGDSLANSREVNELQTSILRVDTDQDGLSDYFEVTYSYTSPTNNDTDFDGLSDGAEYNIYRTNPNNPDTDDDDLIDGLEIKYNTSPLDKDSDSDGLLDGLEIKYNTSPTNPDTDEDGLPDGDEIDYSTNPLKNDTDGDGLTDFTEITVTHTNPLDADSDNDGLTDYEEYKVYHTNPLKKDTDDDGVPDGAEVAMGFDPNNSRSNPNSIFYVAVAFWWVFLTIFSLGIIVGLAIAQSFKYVKKIWYRSLVKSKTSEFYQA